MRTKSQEMEILKETSAKLGKDSYLGPWIDSVAFELEAMMRADCFPCVSLTESAELVAKITAEAERKADQIVTNAKHHAEQMTNAARYRAEEIAKAAESDIDRARKLIREASNSLLAIEERL